MSDKESLAYRIIWRRQEIIRINVRTGEETKHLLELVNKFVRLAHKKKSLRIVAFSDWRGHYTYPIRRHSGLARVSRLEASQPKWHQKSDNYDFLRELIKVAYKN